MKKPRVCKAVRYDYSIQAYLVGYYLKDKSFEMIDKREDYDEAMRAMHELPDVRTQYGSLIRSYAFIGQKGASSGGE